MNKNIKKMSLAILVSIALVGCSSSKNDKDSLGSMGNQSVNTEEAYAQARITNKAEGFFAIANKQLLEKDYSYKKNKKVKTEVDKQISDLEKNNPDAIKEYNVKNAMELLEKSGSILQIQEEQYAKAMYLKEEVTDKKLKEMYDNREGELISYNVIKLSDEMFEGDSTKTDAKVKEVKAKLAKANKDNVEKTFDDIVKDLENADGTSGKQENVERTQVDKVLLKKLDTLKHMEFTKEEITLDDGKYFVLKTGKDDRLSFDASKEKLKDLAFTNATSNNSYLVKYYLMNLRAANKVKMTNEQDQKIYDQATKQLKADYDEAVKNAKEGDE